MIYKLFRYFVHRRNAKPFLPCPDKVFRVDAIPSFR